MSQFFLQKLRWKYLIALCSVSVLILAIVGIQNMVAQETEEIQDEGSISIKLFFMDSEGQSLAIEQRTINEFGNVIDQIKLVLIELIRGSTTGLLPTIPQGTEIKEVFLDDKGCVYVDFSRAISQNHPGGTTGELVTITSIVNTLTTNFPKEIRKVRILVDSQEAKTLAGHVDISKPIFPL